MIARCWLSRKRLVSNPDWRNAHVGTCLACQAEAVRYRSLRRQLAEMRSDVIPAPTGFEPAVAHSFRAVDGPPKKTVVRETAVAAAGLAAMVGAFAILRHRTT